MQRLQLCIAIGLMQKRTADLYKISEVLCERQAGIMQNARRHHTKTGRPRRKTQVYVAQESANRTYGRTCESADCKLRKCQTPPGHTKVRQIMPTPGGSPLSCTPPASLRLTFLQMKNIIISKRAANLRKSSFAARFIFKLDMIVKSV